MADTLIRLPFRNLSLREVPNIRPLHAIFSKGVGDVRFTPQSGTLVHAALLLLMLGARTTVTPYHHQPEAQHPKSFSYPQAAGRLPHLWVISGSKNPFTSMSALPPKADMCGAPAHVDYGPKADIAPRRTPFGASRDFPAV